MLGGRGDRGLGEADLHRRRRVRPTGGGSPLSSTLQGPFRLPREWLSAAAVLGPLLLIALAGYLTVRYVEESNPRRAVIEAHWPLVREDETTRPMLAGMGQPDEDRPADELVGRHRCVQELTWYLWPEERQGETYSVCLDAAGVVRRKSEPFVFGVGGLVAFN